jgi:hypothetical protein
MKRNTIGFCGLVVILTGIILASCVSTSNNSGTSELVGKMSKIELIIVEQRNYIDYGGERDTYPDGLVFYFLIEPLKENWTRPILEELRDFQINGRSYLEITREAGIEDIEPLIVIYDANSINNDERFRNVRVPDELRHIFMLKATICGARLPKEGVGVVRIGFGFDDKVEYFRWQFNLSDIIN